MENFIPETIRNIPENPSTVINPSNILDDCSETRNLNFQLHATLALRCIAAWIYACTLMFLLLFP